MKNTDIQESMTPIREGTEMKDISLSLFADQAELVVAKLRAAEGTQWEVDTFQQVANDIEAAL